MLPRLGMDVVLVMGTLLLSKEQGIRVIEAHLREFDHEK